MVEGSFARTVGLIYEVATSPARWPDLLTRLGGDFRCHNVALVRGNSDRSWFEGQAVGVAPDEHQAYLRRFHKTVPLRSLAPPRYSGHIVQLCEIMPRAEFARTEAFEVYFRPNDIGDGVRLTTWHGETGSETISLTRSAKLGPLGDEELTLARALTPHLERMAAISLHLRGADLLMRSAYEALNGVQQPILVLDGAGRIVHANPAAEALLRTADGLTAREGTLVAATNAGTRQLSAVVAAAAQPDGTAGTLRLRRPSGQLPLALLAMPLGWDHVLLRDRPAALVCISDPASRRAASTDLLISLFGLTRAEAVLAAELLAGREVREIAQATGRSVNTVRTHLAHLMAKTDTKRQSELVGMLERLSTMAKPPACEG